MMAQNGTKNGVRRAFVDVSNTKRTSRDDSVLVGKPTTLPEKGGMSQPAQRQIPLAVTKGLVEKVTGTKPMNPAGKAQPTYKTTKRNSTIFKDQLQPVPEKDTSKENNRTIETVQAPAKLVEANVIKEAEKANVAPEPYKALQEELPSHIESDATISEPEDIKEVQAKELVSAVSEPEEYWDEDETEYYAAPTYPSRGDNTTGGTAVIYPKMNAMTRRQMFLAKDIVESQLTEEDIIEDRYDTTMVAEYNDEIFLHLRQKEVCSYSQRKR
jgi:hypothetical protein